MRSEVIKMWGIARIVDIPLAIILMLSMNFSSRDIVSLDDFFGSVWLGVLAYGVVTFGALFFATSYLWIWLARRRMNLKNWLVAAGSSVVLWLSLVAIHLFGEGFEYARWDILISPWVIFGVVIHGFVIWLAWKTMIASQQETDG